MDSFVRTHSRIGNTSGITTPSQKLFFDSYYIQDYELVSDSEAEVQVVLSSSAFDAYLFLIDGETGRIFFDQNDDSGPGTDVSCVATVRPGDSILVRATTVYQHGTGAFTLQTKRVPAVRMTPPQDVAASLASSDPPDPSYPNTYYMDQYDLSGVAAGQIVSVDMVAALPRCEKCGRRRRTGQRY